MDFKSMSIDDIIDWCKANGQIEWLKATVAKQTEYKAYPRKAVPATNKDGTPKLKEDGTPVMKYVADKNQPYTIKKHPITFVEIKSEFIAKFMPELAPKAKDKKPTFYDRIRELQ